MRARFWWTLRQWWHLPEMYREAAWPTKLLWTDPFDGVVQINPSLKLAWQDGWKRRAAHAWLLTSTYTVRGYYWARRWSGLSCAGGEPQPITGHLRTALCDWLERKYVLAHADPNYGEEQ